MPCVRFFPSPTSLPFEHCKHTVKNASFSKCCITQTRQLVAAILHLGNLKFMIDRHLDGATDNGDDLAKIRYSLLFAWLNISTGNYVTTILSPSLARAATQLPRCSRRRRFAFTSRGSCLPNSSQGFPDMKPTRRLAGWSGTSPRRYTHRRVDYFFFEDVPGMYPL